MKNGNEHQESNHGNEDTGVDNVIQDDNNGPLESQQTTSTPLLTSVNKSSDIPSSLPRQYGATNDRSDSINVPNIDLNSSVTGKS